MIIPDKMKCARMHEIGAPLVIEEIETPRPRRHDVLVRVRACGIVPNLANVLANWPTWFPEYPLPRLPAIFGLDPAGEIAAVGEDVLGFKVGDRVYVNAGRGCDTCSHCVAGNRIECRYFAMAGYFALSHDGLTLLDQYPYGGMAQYMTAPTSALVKLSDTTTFEEAARFGYIGTAYGGLAKTDIGPSSTVLINGCSGTLGVSSVLTALAMGARKVLGTGRNAELLERIKAIDPHRITVFSTLSGTMDEWVQSETDGNGADIVLDCLGPGSSQDTFIEGFQNMDRGGQFVNIGAIQNSVPILMHYLTSASRALLGSTWFTTEQARQVAAMAGSGVLNMSVFKHHVSNLDDVNQAISGMTAGNGGLDNYVIAP